EALTGRGVRGKIGGLNHFVGNHRLAEENQVCGPHVEAELARVEADGKTGVVLTTDKQALAVVAVSDTLRPGAREVVEELTAMGIQVALVSGDAAAPVASVARHVGVTTVHPELLPHEKARVIQSLRDCLGPIGMVGDGINDAPALACASVGFAMGAAGTASALETADVALMQDDLHKIPLFIRLSRATGAVLAQNIALAIGIKVVFFLLALVGHATLWMAVFADMGASLLVVANGLRLLRFERGRPQPTAPPVSADTPGHSHHHGAGECCGHTHGATVAASASDGAAGCGPTPGAPRAG
ncbi:MAG: HAD-IC family P-type ATPase, partial [Armatimonadetes bacterium]|nr:HAD-IC family P-type ATPase [Armatimonadota bacterium]